MAKPGNAVNDQLLGQRAAVPGAARDIIQFWTKVEDAERIVASGKMGMVEAIETIFECKRSAAPAACMPKPGQPWWRDLDLDGQSLYRIGNLCDTCEAIVGRFDTAHLPIAPSESNTRPAPHQRRS